MQLPRHLVAGLALATAMTSSAVEAGYQEPEREIVAVLDAAPTPAVLLSPDRALVLVAGRPALPSIGSLTQPELRLAGLRFSPVTEARTRRSTHNSLSLQSMEGGDERKVSGLPASPKLDDLDFSPDGRWFAFSHTTETGMELWVAGVSDAAARRIDGVALSGVMGKPFVWLSDNSGWIVRTIPAGRGTRPATPSAPTGPEIQESNESAAANRTYQDLLKTAHDETVFEHFATSALEEISISGERRAMGAPGMHAFLTVSPDSRWVLTSEVGRPFSKVVPFQRFSRIYHVWDRQSGVATEFYHSGLRENVPLGRDSVAVGRRDISWRNDAPATLFWAEARDGGNPRIRAAIRDELYLLEAPFDGPPVSIARLPLRFQGIDWSDGELALVRESFWRTRQVRLHAINPAKPYGELRELLSYSQQDRYNAPGTPMSIQNAAGKPVLQRDATGGIFLSGDGASDDGDHPFVDRLDPATLGKVRLFQTLGPVYERPVALLSSDGSRLLTSIEREDTQPNYYAREGATVRAITKFTHPYPQLKGVRKELVRYTRADGLPLSAILWTPSGWTPAAGPLPTLVWAYPREFVNADDAGQVAVSPNQFARINPNRLTWLVLAGYAVFEETAMPVVGRNGREPNDTFVEQITENARAVIGEGVRRGVTDPAWVAVAGHSYGAFMTANLLAHSNLFTTGIARSGAYNRTLTPFSFQDEDRTYWEAPEVYDAISPFQHADKIVAPLLLVHGAADNNSGTYPINSERMFAALKGMGKPARLVMLPGESHGYASRESILHVAWESQRWLDLHVKGGRSGNE